MLSVKCVSMGCSWETAPAFVMSFPWLVELKRKNKDCWVVLTYKENLWSVVTFVISHLCVTWHRLD